MARVETWFPEFALGHMARFPRHDWDQATVEFWSGLQTLFVRHGVTEPDALEASARLFEQPPAFVGDHPPKLLEAVKTLWRERQAGGTVNTDQARARDTEREENARFDRLAELNWHRTPEDQREVWRDMVKRKLPELCARGDWWLDGLARGWAYDPTWVVGEPPPRPSTPSKPPTMPRTPFVDWSTVDSPSRPADAPCVKPEPANFDDWDQTADLGPEISEIQ